MFSSKGDVNDSGTIHAQVCSARNRVLEDSIRELRVNLNVLATNDCILVLLLARIHSGGVNVDILLTILESRCAVDHAAFLVLDQGSWSHHAPGSLLLVRLCAWQILLVGCIDEICLFIDIRETTLGVCRLLRLRNYVLRLLCFLILGHRWHLKRAISIACDWRKGAIAANFCMLRLPGCVGRFSGIFAT